MCILGDSFLVKRGTHHVRLIGPAYLASFNASLGNKGGGGSDGLVHQVDPDKSDCSLTKLPGCTLRVLTQMFVVSELLDLASYQPTPQINLM